MRSDALTMFSPHCAASVKLSPATLAAQRTSPAAAVGNSKAMSGAFATIVVTFYDTMARRRWG